MATKAFMITDKENKVSGIVSDIDEGNVQINWEDERVDIMTEEELTSLLGDNNYDVEEVELTEDGKELFGAGGATTPAQASIKAHDKADKAPGQEDDNNPKTRLDWIKAVIGDLASASEESIEAAHFAMQQAQIGDSPEHPTDGEVDHNRATIVAKPSDAVGHSYLKTEAETAFKETGLTEENLTKIKTIFEVTVEAAITEKEAELQVKYDAAIDAGLKDVTEKLETKVEEFLQAVVDEWAEENRVAIESTLRTELTMEFLGKLQALFIESYIDVPEDKVNVLEAIVVENKALEDKLNKAVSEKLETAKKIIALEKTIEVAKLSEGLTLPKKTQLAKLVEAVEFVNVENFAKKVGIIKEGFLKDAKVESNILTETAPVVEDDKKPTSSNPAIAAAAAKI